MYRSVYTVYTPLQTFKYYFAAYFKVVFRVFFSLRDILFFFHPFMPQKKEYKWGGGKGNLNGGILLKAFSLEYRTFFYPC